MYQWCGNNVVRRGNSELSYKYDIPGDLELDPLGKVGKQTKAK